MLYHSLMTSSIFSGAMIECLFCIRALNQELAALKSSSSMKRNMRLAKSKLYIHLRRRHSTTKESKVNKHTALVV